MKDKSFICKQIFAACVFFLISFAGVSFCFAQSQKNIIVKNNSDKAVKDYILEIPVRNLNLPVGLYIARVPSAIMPTWELDKEPVKTKEQFMECINEVLDRLNSKISINIKK